MIMFFLVCCCEIREGVDNFFSAASYLVTQDGRLAGYLVNN
jgi:hypothetical protein